MTARRSQRSWEIIAALGSSHVRALHREGVFDQDAADALLAAIDSVAHDEAPEGNLLAMTTAFDDRVDALCASQFAGVTRLGRGSAEVIAAVARIVLREQVLRLASDTCGLSRSLLDLAGAHVVTMLPAYSGSQPVQPTTVAHFLGGVIGPLGRSEDRLLCALEMVDLSPLGAGAMTSSRFSPDREESARIAGFTGTISNTFDAVAAVDYFEAVASAAESALIPIEKLLREVDTWMRASPGAFVFGEEKLIRVPDVPQLRLPEAIDRLLEQAASARAGFGAVRAWTVQAGYGPQLRLDQPLAWLGDSMYESGEFFQQSAALFSGGMEINRAVFGNKAGKGLVTSSDLAEFLIVEEAIAPGDARIIANRVLGMIIDRGMEIAAIDRETIDAAGLLVIGREIGIEIEALSRYLAPRRFLEQRTADGAPAPNAVRAWLKQETSRLQNRQESIVTHEMRWAHPFGDANDEPAPS